MHVHTKTIFLALIPANSQVSRDCELATETIKIITNSVREHSTAHRLIRLDKKAQTQGNEMHAQCFRAAIPAPNPSLSLHRVDPIALTMIFPIIPSQHIFYNEAAPSPRVAIFIFENGNSGEAHRAVH
jgi:hypothetical protein